MAIHTAEQGECLSSIAERFGFSDYRTIWDQPENAELRERRPDPNLLSPGDKVFVPEKAARVERATTGREHGFTLRRPRMSLELVLLLDGEPLATARYSLVVGTRLYEGTTDEQGRLREIIAPDACGGVLRLEGPAIEWELRIGHLDPVTEVTGTQARLNNLGHSCGEIDGVIGPRTRAALRQFQARHGLKPTGAIDAATSISLRKAHDES